MANTSAICSSFKQELLQGKHSFESSGGHTFKIALFDTEKVKNATKATKSKIRKAKTALEAFKVIA